MSKLHEFLAKHGHHLGMAGAGALGAGLGSIGATSYQVHRAKKDAKEFLTDTIPQHLLEHGGKYAAGLGILGGVGALGKKAFGSDSYEELLAKMRGGKRK